MSVVSCHDDDKSADASLLASCAARSADSYCYKHASSNNTTRPTTIDHDQSCRAQTKKHDHVSKDGRGSPKSELVALDDDGSFNDSDINNKTCPSYKKNNDEKDKKYALVGNSCNDDKYMIKINDRINLKTTLKVTQDDNDNTNNKIDDPYKRKNNWHALVPPTVFKVITVYKDNNNEKNSSEENGSGTVTPKAEDLV